MIIVIKFTDPSCNKIVLNDLKEMRYKDVSKLLFYGINHYRKVFALDTISRVIIPVVETKITYDYFFESGRDLTALRQTLNLINYMHAECVITC